MKVCCVFDCLPAYQLDIVQFSNVAEIQEAVTNELKKVQKEEFSPAF